MKQLERIDIDSKIDRKILTQLTNDDPHAINPNEDRIIKIIDLSNSLIEDALRNQYPIPLNNKHKVLTEIGIEVSIYNFYLIRSRNKLTDDVKTSYQNALKLLEDYSRGRKALQGETSEKLNSIITNSRTSKFNNLSLKNY